MRYEVQRGEEQGYVVVFADAADPWEGQVIVQRIVTDPEHGRLAECGTVTIAGKSRTLKIRIDDKPALIAALAEAEQATAEIQKDNVRIADTTMRERGKRVLEVAAQYGLELCWAVEGSGRGEHIGIPHAPRVKLGRSDTPTAKAVQSRTACGWFHGCENHLIEITEDEWAAIVAEHEAAIAAKRVAEEQRESELLAVAVPADAVDAYRRFSGDDEAAWAAEDEAAWSTIRRYGPAIEAQGLAVPGPQVVRRWMATEEVAVED